MPRRRYRRRSSSRRGYSRQLTGKEFAEKHIREAEEFSKEMGGTDQDVKALFFRLDQNRLNRILAEYRRLYGDKPYQYALETIPAWRSGSRKMSGMVAKRLFSVVPPHLSISEKLQLVNSLWEHRCPPSYTKFTVGTSALDQEIVSTALTYVENTVESYFLDNGLQRRFTWLAGADSNARQQLSNSFLHEKKKLAVMRLQSQLPTIRQHISTTKDLAGGVRNTLTIGKHALEFDFRKEPGGVMVVSDTNTNVEKSRVAVRSSTPVSDAVKTGASSYENSERDSSIWDSDWIYWLLLIGFLYLYVFIL